MPPNTPALELSFYNWGKSFLKSHVVDISNVENQYATIRLEGSLLLFKDIKSIIFSQVCLDKHINISFPLWDPDWKNLDSYLPRDDMG
jgi:hypothetical protein